MKKSLFLALLMVLLLSASAFASGFAIIEQSVSGLGSAFSGGAASAEDASSIYFNPAIMTLLEGQQVVAGAHVIVPSAKFTQKSSVNKSGAPVTGSNGGDGGVTGVVPNLYYSNNIGNGFAFGLGINAPFGLSTDYGRKWVGRYHAVESDLMSLNINPAIAYKVNDKFSVGAGVSAMYMKATLSSMADIGAANPAQDVFIENEADSWGYGFNLGVLYQISDATRVGFAYRSKVTQDLKGDTTTEIPAPLVGAVGAFFQNQGVHGTIDLPASASLSATHQVNAKLTLLGDVSWTDWSSFKDLTLYFEGPGIGPPSATNLDPKSSTTVENWDDSWRISVGATYQMNENLILRGGLAYDQTPIPDAEHRTPRIPGEDRTWVALGAGYKFSDRLSGDFGYVHLFVPDSKINKTNNVTGEGSLVGEFDNSVNILSAQLVYSF